MEVYKAIVAVQGELSKVGISKDQKNVQQGFKFRSIDDVYNALAPLLAKHRLCMLPIVKNRLVTERPTAKGGLLFYVVVEVEYTLVSASDGSQHKITTIGEAMDSGDKATNKAMSAAYKYACIQTFCIPTEGDNDADSTTHSFCIPTEGDNDADSTTHYEIKPSIPAPPKKELAPPAPKTPYNKLLEFMKMQNIGGDQARGWCAYYKVEKLSQLNDDQIQEIMEAA